MSQPGRNSLPRLQNIKKEPGITIKTEPGTLDLERLSSFKRPRDLSLGGTPHRAKKIFIPNVNIVRNKSKNVDIATPSTSTNHPPRTNRGDDSRSRGRGRGRGNPPHLIKTWGVFSEGAGGPVRKPSFPSESSGPSVSHITRTSKNERQKIKRELEVDDEDAKLSLQKLFEDHAMDFAEYEPDYMYAPEELPFNKQMSKLAIEKIKEEINEESPTSENVIVKLEDVKEEKIETLESFLRSHDQKLILFQMPDTLPGLGKSSDSEQTTSATSAPTSENISRCTLNDIDEGVVGKIVIYRSGKSKLLMGNTEFSVELGLQSTCLQSVMSIDASPDKTGDMIDLGPIKGSLIVTPDWNFLDNKQ